MINLIKTNIFDSEADIIAHGCNAKGVMGAGIARQIRSKYPKAYEDYIFKYRSTGLSLGEVQLVHVGDKPRFIANCITQSDFGREEIVYVSYRAVANCMFELFRFAAREKYSIAMPKIGSGLSGGRWNTILDLIYEQSWNYPSVAVEIYSLPERGEAQ